MSQLDLNTVQTPFPAELPDVDAYCIHGIYAHLFIWAKKDGKSETIKFTQPITDERFAWLVNTQSVRMMRQVEGTQLHVQYKAHDFCSYEGMGDRMAELIAEGYEDVSYSDDCVNVILESDCIRAAIRKGVMKLKGA
jgi:hypothetical protein